MAEDERFCRRRGAGLLSFFSISPSTRQPKVLLLHEPTVAYPCTLAQEHPNAEVWVDVLTAQVPPDYITDAQ